MKCHQLIDVEDLAQWCCYVDDVCQGRAEESAQILKRPASHHDCVLLRSTSGNNRTVRDFRCLWRVTMPRWSIQFLKSLISSGSVSRPWCGLIVTAMTCSSLSPDLKWSMRSSDVVEKRFLSSRSNECKLLLVFQEEDAHHLVKSLWGLFQSRRHACKTNEAEVSSKPCFVANILDDMVLAVYTIRVWCRIHRCLAKRVNTFIHAQYTIRISDRLGLQFLIVFSEAVFAFALREEHNWRFPVGLHKLDNREHIINFLAV